MTNARLFRIGLVILLLAGGSQPAWPQERSPRGQIYNELLPFVGLEGVRLEIFDLGTAIHSVLGGPLDPGNEGPGISHAEHVNLDKAIRADIEEAFRRASIPVLPSTGSSKQVSPRLQVHIDVTRFASPDTIVVQIKAELLKAAHPLNNPEEVVWYSTWGNTLRSLSTRPQLAAFIQRGARGDGGVLRSTVCSRPRKVTNKGLALFQVSLFGIGE